MFTETYSRLNIIVCSPWSTSTLVTLVMFMIDGVETSACPHTCFCNTLSHIVYCSRRGLQAIPTGIAPSTVQLNLNGNAFQTPSIERQNFTALTRLEHLYMSECAIERIVVDAFADLTSLQWLDLSNNRIKTIEEQTFRGVSLQHLFLNGNRNMQLVAGSFRGLVTTGLYLHDSSLHHIAQNVLRPLNSTVKYLWLNGNDIVKLDVGLESMFSVLQHLRLGENPLRCDCSATWLKRLYDNRREVFRGAPAPSCHSPDRLRGRAFNETTVGEFLCHAPQLTRVEVSANSTSGRLTCAAAGEPVPTIYWIQPSGRATRFLHSTSEFLPPGTTDNPSLENEGTLMIESFNSDNRLFGMYICVANNEAGNVTLTISVPASTSDLPRREVHFVGTPSSSLTVDAPSSQYSEQASVSMMSVEHRQWTKSAVETATESGRSTSSNGAGFTLSQLVVAVVVTHIVTLLFYVLLAALCYWKRCAAVDEFSRRRKHAARRVHHQRSTVCSASSGSTLYTGRTAKLSPQLPLSPSCGSPQREAAVFLNGLGTHRDFFFETAAAYRFRDGEYG